MSLILQHNYLGELEFAIHDHSQGKDMRDYTSRVMSLGDHGWLVSPECHLHRDFAQRAAESRLPCNNVKASEYISQFQRSIKAITVLSYYLNVSSCIIKFLVHA